jgi:hypothetical protein
VTSTTRGSYGATVGDAGFGWITYAAVMLGLAGTFNVIDGIVGLSKSKFYVADASYVFSDLRTWSWIVLVLGALELAAAFRITSGSEFFRWFGIGAASVNGIAQLMALPGYPIWALVAFAMDLIIVYALVVYGGTKLADGT